MKKIKLDIWRSFLPLIILDVLGTIFIDILLYIGLDLGTEDKTIGWIVVIVSTLVISTIFALIIITYSKNRTITFDENNNIKVKTLFTKNSFEINCSQIIDFECHRPRTLTKTFNTTTYSNEDFDDHILIKTADAEFKFYTSFLSDRQIMEILTELQKRSGLKNKEITQKSIIQKNKVLIK